MSINHLNNFIGENLNIGCTKFQATDSIIFVNPPLGFAQGCTIKTDPSVLTTSRKIIWGEVLDYISGGGIINNCFAYQWDSEIPGRCIITLLETGANLNANGSPLILANCRAISGPPSPPITGGFVNCCSVISPNQIQLETHTVSNEGRPFMLCVVY